MTTPDIVQKYSSEMVNQWNKEIDMLPVFVRYIVILASQPIPHAFTLQAGLYSTILTAF